MGDNFMDNRHELERQRNNNGFVYHHPFGRGLLNHKTTKPGMFEPKTALIIIGYLLGVPSTFWTLWNISGWKANVVWALVILFWLYKLVRGCMRLYHEWKEKEIELKNKRDRYNKDIWS